MNIRGMKFTETGEAVDMEIEHPTYGWIPFTASPYDTEAQGRELYARALSGKAGTIAAYTPPPPPTAATLRSRATLSRMEFMLALDDAGLLEQAEALVSHPDTHKRIRIMWENASSFERKHPSLIQMAAALGLTDAQMDAVFGIEVPA